jgi:hypothetical protein
LPALVNLRDDNDSDSQSDDDSQSYYTADSREYEVSGNPFQPSDHFHDAESDIDKLYSSNIPAHETYELNTSLFPSNRLDNSTDDLFSTYRTRDSGGYGWLQELSNLWTSSPRQYVPAQRFVRSVYSGTRRNISSMK